VKTIIAVLLLVSGAVLADISVQDYQGTSIVLAKPAQRIIGLSPHIVENIYSAGAGQKLVGVTAYSNFPEAALKLPIVGDYSRINYELISALKPDLIVAWNSGRQLESAVKLRELGFKVYIDDPHSLEDVARSVRDIGMLADSEEASNTTVDDYLKRLSGLRKQYSNQEKEISVLYQVWMDPLQTLNGSHIVSDVIRLCGGRNIFSDAPSVAPKINIESVISRNPQVIISSGKSEGQQRNRKHWQAWPVIKAVQDNHIYTIPPDYISRHTIRLLNGVEVMCDHFNKVRSRK